MPSIKESIALLFQAVHAWIVRDNKQQWQKISRCHVQLSFSLLLTYVTIKAHLSEELCRNIGWTHSQEKRRVNMDPFLHRIYTIGLYTV